MRSTTELLPVVPSGSPTMPVRSPPRQPTIPDDGPNAIDWASSGEHCRAELLAGSTFWLVGQGSDVRVALEGPVLIGRGPYNHVVLDDTHVSWQHARLVPTEGGVLVHDLNSTNGTTVNDERVARHRLQANDVLRVGRFTFRLERGQPASTRPAPHARSRDVETAAKLRIATPIDLDAIALLEEDAVLEEVSTDTMDSLEVLRTAEVPTVDLRQLEDAHAKLGLLYSFVQAISQSNDTRELIDVVSERIQAVFPQARAVRIYLREDDGAYMLGHDAPGASTHLAEDALRRVAVARRTIVLGDRVLAPMIDKGELVGVVQLEADPIPARSDLDLLDGMASPAAMHLQNTRMRDAKAKRERLERDLELAAEIQRSFLPREVISVEGLDLFVEYRSAYAVGGDFYDVFWVAPGRLGVFVGDISGKGVSAALHMARISSELRSAALAHVTPRAVFEAMNAAVLARRQPELFFTAIYFTLEVETGEIVLGNAGHPSPYVKRATGLTEIVDGGASAIGILDDATFTEERLRLNHGDGLVLYTDGVTEAADRSGALFGDERLETALTTAPVQATELADHLLQRVDRHARGALVNDDLTLFVCQRRADRARSMQPRRRGSGSLAPSKP